VVHRRRVQEGLRRHALPVGTSAAEEISLDDGDAGSPEACKVRGGLAGGPGSNDRDVVVVSHPRMIRAWPA